LSELNQIIAEQRGLTVDSLSIKESLSEKMADKTAVEPKPTATLETAQAVDLTDPVATAKHYRSQADKLAKEAANFRRLAEELVPTKKKAE
jgi:hypothetical protein